MEKKEIKLDCEKIKKNYNEILEDIKKYSSNPGKVKLLFVSKYFDVCQHKEIVKMGYNYFGENRAQLYRDKLNEIGNNGIKWDFIGRLQKNKIKYIIESVNLIHSIDLYDLLLEINKKAAEHGRIVNGLIQINVSKEESKTGIYIEDFEKDYEKYFSQSNVKIIGFMTMAPFSATTDEIDNYFKKMQELREKFSKKYDYLTELSMGMSNDYKIALKNGATIIRIGSKLFE